MGKSKASGLFPNIKKKKKGDNDESNPDYFLG